MENDPQLIFYKMLTDNINLLQIQVKDLQSDANVLDKKLQIKIIQVINDIKDIRRQITVHNSQLQEIRNQQSEIVEEQNEICTEITNVKTKASVVKWAMSVFTSFPVKLITFCSAITAIAIFIAKILGMS